MTGILPPPTVRAWHFPLPVSPSLGHVTATSANTVFDNRETIHTTLGADSPLRRTPLPAPSLTSIDAVSGGHWGGWVNGHVSNLTHIDPFSGGRWGGRVTGHELTLPTHTASRQRHAIDQQHPPLHHPRSSFVSDSIPTSFSTVFSPPGSDPPLSPDQSWKKRAFACTGGHGQDHIGHTHTNPHRHALDNNDRRESRTNPDDVDKAATPAAMLMEGETAQSPLSVQNNTSVWASLAHNVLDSPGTSVGSSRRQLGCNPAMDAPESAVHMTMGDSGTAHDSMMEVEEETSVTDLGDNLHLPSTVGMDSTSAQDMEAEEAGPGGDMPGFSQASLITTTDSPSPLTIDWASLGQSEFDLPGTSVSASRSRPDPPPIINLHTLGQGDIAMPGDTADLTMNAIAPKVNRKKKKKRSKSHRAAHLYGS